MVEGLTDLRGLTMGRMLAERAKRNGDKPALIFQPDCRTLSYAQLEEAANRLANGLKRAGFAKGSHVAVYTDNRLEQVVAYFALGKMGAVSVPVNTAAKGYFLERFIGHSDCTAVMVETAYLAQLAEVADHLPLLQTLIFFDAPPAPEALPANLRGYRILQFSQLCDSPDNVVDDAQPSDVAQILYTSGTTGPSKGNMFLHSSLLTWAFQLAARTEATEEDIYFSVFPLFHGGAWLNATMTTLATHGTVVIGQRFSASQFIDQARACGATRAMMVSVLSFLIAQPPSPADKDHRVKYIFSPARIDVDAFESRFGIRLVNGYGLTDYGVPAYGSPDDPRDKQLSCGRPMPQWAIRIADDMGYAVPTGEVGEICLRCDIPGGGVAGYYKMPQETLEARRDLWHHTGDMGYMDADGFLHFVDRKKDAIRRRGENISSMELELVLEKHPAIAQSAFFPVSPQDVAADVGGEAEVGVAVIIQPDAQVTEMEIVAYCERHMPKFAVPRFVRIMHSFPLTASGKIQKQSLRKETEEILPQVWDRQTGA